MLSIEIAKVRQRTQNNLIQSLIGELRRGIALIESLDDRIYSKVANDSGSVGGQFRHNIDFVNAFLKGVALGRIDYNKRERDALVEGDRTRAIAKIRRAIAALGGIPEEVLISDVKVRSEVTDGVWMSSCVRRELEFVHSHTVHHHALIAAKLHAMGVAAPQYFGVAPSTLEFWKTTGINKQ